MTEAQLRTVLLEALEDERKAEATYAAVLAKFGKVRPFSNIIDAERRHSSAIERQLIRLGIPVPPNGCEGRGHAPASLAEACRAAVHAEIENIALYDRLLPSIADGMVRQVLENLQAASRDNHLPAFRRCLAREEGQDRDGSRGTGRGRGHTRG